MWNCSVVALNRLQRTPEAAVGKQPRHLAVLVRKQLRIHAGDGGRQPQGRGATTTLASAAATLSIRAR